MLTSEWCSVAESHPQKKNAACEKLVKLFESRVVLDAQPPDGGGSLVEESALAGDCRRLLVPCPARQHLRRTRC